MVRTLPDESHPAESARSAVRCHPCAPRRSAQRPSEWSQPDAPDRDRRRIAVLLTLVAKARDQLVLGHRGATLDAEFLGPLPQLLHRPLLVGAGLGSLRAGSARGPARASAPAGSVARSGLAWGGAAGRPELVRCLRRAVISSSLLIEARPSMPSSLARSCSSSRVRSS